MPGTPDTSSFGGWAKARRIAIGLTREQLAGRSNCAVVTIRKIEEGTRRPSQELAEHLARQLELQPELVHSFVHWARFGTADAVITQPPDFSAAGADNTGWRPNMRLPVPVSSFVGRQAQIAELQTLLQRADVRLVTLTGPPGVGKTRLSLSAVADLRDEPQRAIVFVDLSMVHDPAMMLVKVAQALGVREIADQSLAQCLKAHFEMHPLLLLLDNFEQLCHAGPILAGWLEYAPGLKLLVTSRIVLGIYGEHVFPVPPLLLAPVGNTGTLAELEGVESVKLFVARAQAALARFRLTKENAPAVAGICARLDGLPLAIELAAARTRFLTPQSVLHNLEHRLPLLTDGPQHRPRRQQTLRAALDWSYEILNHAEQRLFARLGVFVGHCTTAGVAAVCRVALDSDQAGADLLSQLATLVNHSLLLVDLHDDGPQFRMLETIREYALEQLERSEDYPEAREQHFRFYLQLAEQASCELSGAHFSRWLALLEQEYDNIQAALDWACEQNPDLGLQLAVALGQFWQLNAHYVVGRKQLSRLVALTRESAPKRETGLYLAGRLAYYQGDFESARDLSMMGIAQSTQLGEVQVETDALCTLGLISCRQGDLATARTYLQESLRRARRRGDQRSIANALLVLGHVARNEGDYLAGYSLYEESLKLYRELDDRYGIAEALGGLGSIAILRAQYTLAEQLLEETLAIQHNLQDRWGLALTQSWLGDVALGRANFEKAVALYREGLVIHRTLGNKWGVAMALLNLGEVARCQGDFDLAWQLNHESLLLSKDVGNKEGAASAIHNLGHLARQRGDHRQETAFFIESLAMFKAQGDKLGMIACLAGLAGAAVHKHMMVQAAQLLAAVEVYLQAAGAHLEPADRQEYVRNLDAIRANVNGDELAQAWSDGRGMSINEAHEFVLQVLS